MQITVVILLSRLLIIEIYRISNLIGQLFNTYCKCTVPCAVQFICTRVSIRSLTELHYFHKSSHQVQSINTSPINSVIEIF